MTLTDPFRTVAAVHLEELAALAAELALHLRSGQPLPDGQASRAAVEANRLLARLRRLRARVYNRDAVTHGYLD